ncbi:MAG: substrate-binding domain-containing protein [Candidatus Lokiarchaeia archaeon]
MVVESSLQVYASGGVAPPIKRAAEVFEEKYGTNFDFTIGKAEMLISKIKEPKKGDVLSCGAEYILDEAQELGIILRESRRSVGNRRSVILVQKGNPKGIKSLQDLTEEGMRLGISVSGCLVGVWDDVCSKAGLIDQIRENIYDLADGCGAVMALINQKKVDAILGWSAFRNIWPGTSEIVEIPNELEVYRSTGVATISYSKEAELANRFIDFLTSNEGRSIYTEFGWVHNL